MSNVTLLAIDLAKNIFQLHGTDAHGKAIINKRIKSRDQLSKFVANLNPCNIYMEGCGSANYWGRKFKTFGHQVKLINPKYVKPYVMGSKNDKNDAIAIAKAARDPAMRFGEVKLQEQQDVQSTHRMRSHFVSERTALANATRGSLAEHGIVVAKGVGNIRKLLPIILENNEYNLNCDMLMNIQILYDNLVFLDKTIEKYNAMIDRLFENNEVCGRLEKIPGVGKIGATILAAALGNGSAFKNGRHFAAFLGLVPKQHSSGNKEKLLGISKVGDTYIRTILVHGARSVTLYADKKTDNQSVWLKNLKARSGSNIAAVAMANRIARTAWALVAKNAEYKINYKPTMTN